MKRHDNKEQGSTLILIIFAALAALAVVLGIMSATSLYIERKRLFTLADAAALHAAEAFDLNQVRITQSTVFVDLTSPQVHAATLRYLALIPRTESKGVKVVSARTKDGRSSEVTFQKQWVPPVFSFFFPEGFPISVTARARTVF